MMKTLTNFGIVLVVLAMVTGSAFANTYQGPPGDTWCNPANWSDGTIPNTFDGKDTKIENDDLVVVNGTCMFPPYGADKKLELRDNSTVQIGTGGYRAKFDVKGELEMSDDKTSEFTTLNIANGVMTVYGESKDVFEDGSGEINIAAGSSLTFEDGLRFGDSNGDGCNDSYTLNIAGHFENDGEDGGDRLQVYGGTLTINLTGNGTFLTEETTRFSRKKDARTVVNISDNGVFTHDKDIEIGSDKSGQDCPPSLEINISDNGIWTGCAEGKDIEYKKDGQSVYATITDNGSLCVKNYGEKGDALLNLTVDGAGASFTVEDDMDIGQGEILILNGEFTVEDDFELGGKGDTSMLVSTDGVFIDDLEMDDAELTIVDCRVDLDSLEMKGDSSINIVGNGAELVIKDADDQEDWDAIDDLINDGQITTSQAGMAVVWDHDVRNSGRLTIYIVKPVTVDIKPGTCPNPLRVNFIGQGVFAVAIVGSEELDVLDVDVATVTLQGVAPVRSNEKDISTIGAEVCGCTTLGPDGVLDLELKFKRAELLIALQDSGVDYTLLDHRSQVPLTLNGFLHEPNDDVAIQGSDCLTILNRGQIKVKK